MKTGIIKGADEISKDVAIIIAAKGDIVKNFLIIGGKLLSIQESKSWRFYGSHLTRFEDFLVEVRIGRATAYNLMAIYERFGEHLREQGLDIEYTRLMKLLPLTRDTSKRETVEWLVRAQELPADAFEDELREAKGLPARDTCAHKDCDWWKHCRSCNKFIAPKKEPSKNGKGQKKVRKKS